MGLTCWLVGHRHDSYGISCLRCRETLEQVVDQRDLDAHFDEGFVFALSLVDKNLYNLQNRFDIDSPESVLLTKARRDIRALKAEYYLNGHKRNEAEY